MRKFTTITERLRILIPGLPSEAKYVGITINKITWDSDDWEYNNGFNKHDYIHESIFIQNCEKLKLIIVKTNTNNMNFLNELKALNEAYVSPKLEEVKTKLKVQAKSGNKMATLRASEIDTYTAKWLKNEGLTIEDSWSGTREEGESIVIIKW